MGGWGLALEVRAAGAFGTYLHLIAKICEAEQRRREGNPETKPAQRLEGICYLKGKSQGCCRAGDGGMRA